MSLALATANMGQGVEDMKQRMTKIFQVKPGEEFGRKIVKSWIKEAVVIIPTIHVYIENAFIHHECMHPYLICSHQSLSEEAPEVLKLCHLLSEEAPEVLKLSHLLSEEAPEVLREGGSNV
ncbi:hypothetical protein J437_LFUL007931 [Ladona fulva]|uniref:Uncharacterized protein n=1 Tax=Ladona fulva TaxID=123851 RepID=A0A8K0K8N6_LADFU|nr:hypothetical protein J437_LFUL007931 [Ladona fulva]